MGVFKNSILQHQALTQFHRWYQAYEAPLNDHRFNNQLEILDNDITIDSAAGISTGKESLRERMNRFDGWQNAHHVHHTIIEQIDEYTISLEADILYQNIRPDASRFSYTLHYSTILNHRQNDLPLFKSIKITPTGDADPDLFEDAYIKNRAASFINYWFYLLENGNETLDGYKEILADNFQIKHADGKIAKNFEEFKDWIISTNIEVLKTAHYPKNMTVVENPDKTITVDIDADWQGMSLDNEPMQGLAHYQWILQNNLDDRFAKTISLNVSSIERISVIK